MYGSSVVWQRRLSGSHQTEAEPLLQVNHLLRHFSFNATDVVVMRLNTPPSLTMWEMDDLKLIWSLKNANRSWFCLGFFFFAGLRRNTLRFCCSRTFAGKPAEWRLDLGVCSKGSSTSEHNMAQWLILQVQRGLYWSLWWSPIWSDALCALHSTETTEQCNRFLFKQHSNSTIFFFYIRRI